MRDVAQRLCNRSRRRQNVSMRKHEDKGSVASAVLSTLSPGDVGKPFADSDREQAMIPTDWQRLGTKYGWAEIHGVTHGLPHGYLTDLLGRAAAAGEQLGIAFAALRDAEVWRDTKPTVQSANQRSIAGRAMAEASGLWAVSAGHAAVNVVARVLRIHGGASNLDKKLQWTGLPVPFDSGKKANLSLNAPTVKKLALVAEETGEVALAKLIEPLETLVTSESWAAVMERRDAGYHRLRPQSIDGGVPQDNPWALDNAGSLTLTVSVFANYVPPVLETVVSETQDGYKELASAMRTIHDTLPSAFKAVGIPIWRES